MSILMSIIELLRRLHAADASLQPAMRQLLEDYHGFTRGRPSNRLVLRTDRGHGLIRRICWAVRSRARKKVGLQMRHLRFRLRGRFRHSWVYDFACDWSRLKAYQDFERRRDALVSSRSLIVKARRALRLGFAYRWGTQACASDVERARLLAEHEGLMPEDVRAIAGAVTLEHRLTQLLVQMGVLIDEYRATFKHSTDVDFEPSQTWQDNGTFRLSWGFPRYVPTSEGMQRRTDPLPGEPTDRWMRKYGIRVPTRRAIGAWQKRMRPLKREYREHVHWLGEHRRKAASALSVASRGLARAIAIRDREALIDRSSA